MEWNVGVVSSRSINIGYLWLYSIQGHFGLIRCTCDFSEDAISTKHYFSYKLQPKFIKLVLNYLLNSPHKTMCWELWNFEILTILALYDHVSRGHEIVICPSSVSHPSSARLWHRLSLNLWNRFLSNLVLGCPGPWALTVFGPFGGGGGPGGGGGGGVGGCCCVFFKVMGWRGGYNMEGKK